MNNCKEKHVRVRKTRGFFPLIGAKFFCSSYQYPRRARDKLVEKGRKENTILSGAGEEVIVWIGLFCNFSTVRYLNNR